MSNPTVLENTLEHLDTNSNTPKYAHYAESASVTEGYIMGTPVIALCGKIFVPSRDPEKLRICPTCKKIAEALFLSTE
jgi:hypothetical protein